MIEEKFTPIRSKIVSFVLIILFIGIGSITFWLARDLFLTLEQDAEKALSIQAESLYYAIENLMIAGEADLAVNYLEDIRENIPKYTISLFRNSGEPAFGDNETINAVNQRLGSVVFAPQEKRMTMNVWPNGSGFKQALEQSPDPVFIDEKKGSKHYIRVYRSLINLPNKCIVCHGDLPTIRGVIDIRDDITPIVETQRKTMIRSTLLFIAMLMILTYILTRYLRRNIISPINRIGDLCGVVTAGDFSKRVSVTNQDEIGLLAERVNTMVDGLYERFELSKFVSGTTLKSIHGKKEGIKSELTLFFSDIRGFTSFSESVSPETVVHTLNNILNFQTEIIHHFGGDVDKYVGDEIVAIFQGRDAEKKACQAAKAIQKELANNPAPYKNLKLGIGINTGEIILGMIGSRKRADYTVIGDHVNVASRLCSAAQKGQIILSASTYGRVKKYYKCKGPFALSVKGKKQKLKIFTLE